MLYNECPVKEVEQGVGDRNGEFFDRFARLLGELAQFLALTRRGSFGAGTLNFDSDFGSSNGMSRGTGGGVIVSDSSWLGVVWPSGVGVVPPPPPLFLIEIGLDSIE